MTKIKTCSRAAIALVLALGSACTTETQRTPTDESEVASSSAALTDTSTPVGTWYLLDHGSRLEMRITNAGGLRGTIHNEGSSILEPMSDFSWDPDGRWLEFRRNGPGYYQWYRMSVTYGVVNGRFSHATSPGKPPLTSYVYHVTGWSPDWLDSSLVPRTWNLTIGTGYEAVLRIDRDARGVLIGRLKVYNAHSQVVEELENDLSNIRWDGTKIDFVRNGPGFTQQYSGTANGRFISGTFTHNGAAAGSWNGARGEVLGFGLGSRLAQRDAWQAATRARIVNLTEGMRLAGIGIPAVTVTNEPCVGCPFLNGWGPERDDNPLGSSTNYSLQRLKFSVSPGSRFDPAHPPPVREYYGYLATPTTPPPPGGYPAVVAVNGHDGSAQIVMTSNSWYWYGESAARHGKVVLAIDIGHRPVWNWGPIFHPPIVDSGYTDSNWEEDGERAFSVRRAIDYLESLSMVRRDRILIEGLSMGGEITTITAGLDPRLAMAIPSGYSPDMHVMDIIGNHPCYRWNNSDIHEYLDASDYEALIAPRPLLVQTGVRDTTFSRFPTPFSGDKQVTRRARAAYGPDASKVIHFLHYDAHAFHVGDVNPTNTNRPLGVHATAVTDASFPGDLAWQMDSSTFIRSPSVYALVHELLP